MLNIDDKIERAANIGIVRRAKSRYIPGAADNAIIVGQALAIADTPSQMQGTEHLGVESHNKLQPMLRTGDLTHIVAGIPCPDASSSAG